jgi:hypothetical protein
MAVFKDDFNSGSFKSAWNVSGLKVVNHTAMLDPDAVGASKFGFVENLIDGPSQFAQMKIVALVADSSGQAVVLRVYDPGSANTSALMITAKADGSVSIIGVDVPNSHIFEVITSTAAGVIAAGKVLRGSIFQVSATRSIIAVHVDDDLVLSVDAPSWVHAMPNGSIGMYLGDSVCAADNFQGGALSVREKIMRQVIDALNTDRPMNIPKADRRKLRPYTPDELPAIDVIQASEEVQPIANKTSPLVNRLLKIRIRAWVKDTEPDSAIDPLLAWMTDVIAGNTFNGMANYTLETLNEWNAEEADAVYGVVSREYVIEYSTSRTNEESRT